MHFYYEIRILLAISLFGLKPCFGYIRVNFENVQDSMCKGLNIFPRILGTHTQNLRHHDNSGMILDYNSSGDDFSCNFKVNYASENDGVIAVIQSISMRKNETTGQCIDYVQFKSKDGSSSDQFCGKFDVVSRMNGHPSSLDTINFGNSFRTKNHKLHVFINVGKQLKRNDKVEFRIVFTAYKNCSQQRVMDLMYKPCKESSDFCIYSGFFNDNYVNCPLPGCVDEGSCLKFVTMAKPPSLGTKLLVSSVSFLFILFITFLISIWACKKHKVACFSEHFSNPDRTRQIRVIEMNDTSARSDRDRQSPAVPPVEVDKDLPPKYEDLFPDR